MKKIEKVNSYLRFWNKTSDIGEKLEKAAEQRDIKQSLLEYVIKYGGEHLGKGTKRSV